MRFVITEESFSCADHYHITDADGNDMYLVYRKSLREVSFKDVHDNELMCIKSNKNYEIHREKCYAVIRDKSISLCNIWRYAVEVMGKENVTVRISYWGNKWKFIRSGKIFCTASAPFLSFKRPLVIDIPENEDTLLFLVITVAIYISYRLNAGHS